LLLTIISAPCALLCGLPVACFADIPAMIVGVASTCLSGICFPMAPSAIVGCFTGAVKTCCSSIPLLFCSLPGLFGAACSGLCGGLPAVIPRLLGY
jgi:hypothetical protein